MTLPYTNERFGNKIRKLREKRNWSLKELEEITGINRQYLSKIEQGTAKRLKLSHLETFIECFNTTLKDILTFTE